MYDLKLKLVYIILFLFINNYNLCYYSLRKDVNIMKSSWDLSHLYTSEEKWQYDFDKLSKTIDEMNNFVFEVNVDSINLFLANLSKMNVYIEKLYCYQKRKVDLDIKNDDAKLKANKALDLYSKIINISNHFEAFVISNQEDIIKLLSDKYLIKFKRYIELIIRKNKHITNIGPIDKKINEIRNEYRSLLEKLRFENILEGGQETELTKSNYSSLMRSQNEQIRKQTFNNYLKGYAYLEKDLLECFLKKYMVEIELSKSEKFSSLLDKKLFNLELPSLVIKELIAKTNEHLYLTRHYVELKKELLCTDKLNSYDGFLSICDVPDYNISFEKAYEMINESLKILGNDYISEVKEIFNDGWIDLYPKDGKNGMSFTSISYPGSYILTNFKNDLTSTRTIAHEIGHRINSKYSAQNNDILNFEFSMLLTEIASKVNEMLFNNYIIEKCDDPELKKYILNDVIAAMFNSLFGQMMLTEFEVTIISKIESGETITEDIINNLYLKIYEKYNLGIEQNDFIKYGWLKIQHFIMQDSYYLFQYTIGTAIALNISRRILDQEPGFLIKYKKFLSVGNSLSVTDALKLLDIDLKNGMYIEQAYSTLENNINSMKELCKK